MSPDDDYEVIEIGSFGKPEHDQAAKEFRHAFEDQFGSIHVARYKAPDGPFTVESGGITIYRWHPIYGGFWYGSEVKRRNDEGLLVVEKPYEKNG